MKSRICSALVLFAFFLLTACSDSKSRSDPPPPPPPPPPPEPTVNIPSNDVFVNWENHPINALALSPDNNTLAAVNTPDNRVELFSLESGEPVSIGAVSVGLDPVSVRFLTNDELWVANHISDTISIVDVSDQRVRATLQTCDEPYDLVFAGGGSTGVEQRAYISCSQVNQVQVVTTADLQTQSILDIPVAEDPRGMAVSADGSEVYVAIFESSNATTLLSGSDRRELIPNVVGGNASDPITGEGEGEITPGFVCTNGPYGGNNPPPNTGGPTTDVPDASSFVPPINPAYLPGGATPAPPVGLIVRKNADGDWFDDNGGDWTDFVSNNVPSPLSAQLEPTDPCDSLRVTGWDMPDRDIAVIDVTDNSIGYINRLMNMVMAIGVNPANGNITAVGTEAINEVRFEPNVNGIFVRVNLATVQTGDIDGTDALDNATIADLNPHLDYSNPTVAQAQRDLSLGDPRGIVWNQAGNKAYITGMGSNNVIAINADGSRNGSPIEVGEGPIALSLDESRERLYVLNRFEGSLSIIDTSDDSVADTIALFDPTVSAIKAGRKHLYDTHATSGLGQVSCASCHVDARTDRLSWDLGDPGGAIKAVIGTDVTQLQDGDGNPTAGAHNIRGDAFSNLAAYEDWHPMKGPMTTQTMQDIIGTEPLHHRGDQDGLEGFNGAFQSLQGDDEQLTDSEMQEYEDFLATIAYPPNPFRNFDNTFATAVNLPLHVSFGRYEGTGGLSRGDSLPVGNARNGFALYTQVATGATRCVVCHTFPTGMGTLHRFDLGNNTPIDIPPGPNGERHSQMVSSDTNIHRGNKIQGWRQLYEKVGLSYTNQLSAAGFGNMSDGREPGVDFRAQARIFNFGNDQNVADFVAMVMSFTGSGYENPNPVSSVNPPGPPSQDTHAAVGKQVTISNGDPIAFSVFANNIAIGDIADVLPVDVLEAMVALADPDDSRVDVIAKGFADGRQQGWYYDRTQDLFFADIPEVSMSLADLRASAAEGSEITFTLVPRDSGARIGIDRDFDGTLDGE